jgi:hypothetical protein
MTKPEVYSKYWRKNRSRHEATELALGLRALRKVAGHLGPNVKPIFWDGMVEANESVIILRPDDVKGLYPMPPRIFDILVGQVAHEGLASIEWTELVRDRVRKDIPKQSPEIWPFLENFIEAAEDIYIYQLTGDRIWSKYLFSFYRQEAYRNFRDPSLPPSGPSLANIWRRKVIMDDVPNGLHFYYDDLLEILTQSVAEIKKVALQPSLRSRREGRIILYQEIWSALEAVISEWEIFLFAEDAIGIPDQDAPPGDLDKDLDELKAGDEEDDQRESGKLGQELVDQINAILEDEESDLAKNVAVAVSEPEARSMPVEFKRGQALVNAQADPILVKRLERIFYEQEALIRKSRKRYYRRGLFEGRLDHRRLYRVPLDGRVFKNRENPSSDYLWQICLVADASASMTGRSATNVPWHTAEKTFIALTKASEGFKNILDIFAYNAERSICTLTQLYHGRELYTVVPTGRTPSGQAIMAAALSLKKKYKRSMIIHITDGAANCGLPLSDAVDYCLRNNIDVFTIGCDCNQQTRDFLHEAFPPERLYFMKNIDYLAEGLERLFKQKILATAK